MASIGGEAKPLGGEMLPSRGDVYQLYLHMTNVKVASGEWTKFTPLGTKSKIIVSDIVSVWEKTGIPHNLSGTEGEERVERLIMNVKKVQKVPLKQRNDASTLKQISDLRLDKLFDIAKCCCDGGTCSCPEEDKVPVLWRPFLQDQRGARSMTTHLGERKASLRCRVIYQKFPIRN